jgi:hypothetical protein
VSLRVQLLPHGFPLEEFLLSPTPFFVGAHPSMVVCDDAADLSASPAPEQPSGGEEEAMEPNTVVVTLNVPPPPLPVQPARITDTSASVVSPASDTSPPLERSPSSLFSPPSLVTAPPASVSPVSSGASPSKARARAMHIKTDVVTLGGGVGSESLLRRDSLGEMPSTVPMSSRLAKELPRTHSDNSMVGSMRRAAAASAPTSPALSSPALHRLSPRVVISPRRSNATGHGFNNGNGHGNPHDSASSAGSTPTSPQDKPSSPFKERVWNSFKGMFSPSSTPSSTASPSAASSPSQCKPRRGGSGHLGASAAAGMWRPDE